MLVYAGYTGYARYAGYAGYAQEEMTTDHTYVYVEGNVYVGGNVWAREHDVYIKLLLERGYILHPPALY